MKTDIRIIRTERNIQEAMRELLSATEFSKITVQMICEKALINRKTFYTYYMDKYNLLEVMLEKEKQAYISDWMEQVKMNNSDGPVDGLYEYVYQSINERMPIIKKYRNCLGQDFIDVLFDIVSSQVFERLASIGGDGNDEVERYIFTWYVVGYIKYMLDYGPIKYTDYYTKQNEVATLQVNAMKK